MGKRILLIDDDDLLCEVLGDFLELAGYPVKRAANGREGLEQLAGDSGFDLILLDLLMPEMDGISFLRSLDRVPGSACPVLILSASATAQVISTIDFPRVAGVIRKPVKPPVLLEQIAALIGPG